MGIIEYVQIIFLVLVLIIGIGGFIWAVNKDEE
jgi:hypothetical protein